MHLALELGLHRPDLVHGNGLELVLPDHIQLFAAWNAGLQNRRVVELGPHVLVVALAEAETPPFMARCGLVPPACFSQQVVQHCTEEKAIPSWMRPNKFCGDRGTISVTRRCFGWDRTQALITCLGTEAAHADDRRRRLPDPCCGRWDATAGPADDLLQLARDRPSRCGSRSLPRSPCEFRVVRYDRRGHGKSGTAGPWSFERFGRDVLAILNALNILHRPLVRTVDGRHGRTMARRQRPRPLRQNGTRQHHLPLSPTRRVSGSASRR